MNGYYVGMGYNFYIGYLYWLLNNWLPFDSIFLSDHNIDFPANLARCKAAWQAELPPPAI